MILLLPCIFREKSLFRIVEQQQYYGVIDACFTDPEKRYWKQQEIIAVFREFGVKVTIPKLNSLMFQMSHDTELGLYAPIGSRLKRGFAYGDREYSIEKKKESITLYSKIAQRLLTASSDDPIASLPWSIKGFIRYVTKNEPEKEGFTIMDFREFSQYGIKYEINLGKIILAILDRKPVEVTIDHHNYEGDSDHTLHPYYFAGPGLDLIAYSENYGEMMPFYLEQIVDVCELEVQPGGRPDHSVTPDFLEDKRKLISSRGEKSIAVSFPPQLKGYLARYKGSKAKPRYTVIQDDETVFRIDWHNPQDEALIVYQGYGVELVDAKLKGRRKG